MIKNNRKKIISQADAIKEGLIQAATKDKNVIFFAEGVQDPSYFYGTMKDLNKYISKNRLIEMPISENALCGVAIGASLMQKRPVISFQRIEFALLAFEQIVNNAAKSHYVSVGKHKIPLVMRLIIGRGWGQGPAHSQSLEAVFSHFPGLKVVMPAFPEDGKGMMIAAIRDNNPVIFIEHRWCHYTRGKVKKNYFSSDLKGPKKIVNGKDITIVSTSYMTLESVRAAEKLKKIGISCEVIDLRVLRPLNLSKIIKSLKKTGRILTVDTGFKMHGIGGEIISNIVEKNFKNLRSKPVRLGLPDHPIPSSRGYLKNVYPDSVKIIETIGDILKINNDKIKKIIKEVKKERANIPIDVPDPFFKGPF
ncbi:alpha-ketoacid dehydrogenase subunit beta [Candidatus Pelagibacter sp.]|uniref:alpha-ketoacid dehydrogenase subunit beta n=1 Tax=Candidatus Pelagibacter sp. TaxID=2024849 RepID=UPI003D0FE751